MMQLSKEQMQFVSGYRAPPAAAQPLDVAKDQACHTSAAAQARADVGSWHNQQAEVLDICLAAARNGIADLSGREIKARYRQSHPGKDIDTGTISARVSSLLAAKLLERCPERLCSITSKMVRPVRPVAQQQRIGG
jgi:hypothetical protein